MITHQSSISEKIAIFRSLFRGREDIYPRRFENRKTQKSGYSPVCGNEWVRGVCEKPRIKCRDCQYSRFLPITDEVIQWHLLGSDNGGRDFVMGIYPMLLDETCFFLATDFDKASWQEDAVAFLKTCHEMNLPAALERSRSGKGAHVWLFFAEAITASLARKDGHHPIITMRCGPIRYRVNAKEQAAIHPFEHTVLVRPTTFHPQKAINENLRIQFQDLYGELIADADRNQLICNDIIQSIQNNRSPIVLTERNEHLDHLFELLTPNIQHVIVLRGGMSTKKINNAIQQMKDIPENESRALLATGRFIGEGFDDARLDTLFLTLPVSWRGTIAQYVGRLHRLHDLKKEVQVYDYADLNVPMLERMFNRRCRAYEAVGYKIFLPASAVPGWPAEIPLPVDPKWKADYAGTVRRLISDGIDLPLAKLFVQVASPSILDKEGVNRARSATEAFLYRRLETLPKTTGRFRLNAELSIPFDGLGRMEVDLLCSDARVAIEIDGEQHLADAAAYRRDRRKDVLLQESGFMVLRFLAVDIGKHLDIILDSILRAVFRSERQKNKEL